MASTADGTKHTDDTGSFRIEPPTRQRVADHVFETLARGIFTGELKPGTALPTQRELARQFKISALVVRQAIHRLEDMGLVRVRQGSATIILDPEDSTDIRLIQVQMQLVDPARSIASDAFENQMLFTVPMLVLAERRITQDELAVLDYIVESAAKADATEEDGRRFRVEYWRQIAKATHNSMFKTQVRWWSSMIESLEAQGKDYGAPSNKGMVDFYRKLNRQLEAGDGAVDFYLTTMTPVLDWMDKQRGVPPRGAHAARGKGTEAPGADPDTE